MRWILLAVIAMGCAEHGKGGSNGQCFLNGLLHDLDSEFPAGDGCNVCTCETTGVSCTKRACSDAGGPDADPASCEPSGVCSVGVECGAFCCGRGERCDNGTCRCGTNAMCDPGGVCAAAGPIGNLACGTVCCGASGPCPQ